MEDFWMFPVAILFAIGAGAVYAVVSLFTPVTPERAWLSQQTERCWAMRSKLSYDEKTRTAECYRTPFMRKPKLMFTETFKEAN